MLLSFRNFLFYPYVSEIFSSYPSSLPSFPSILLFFLFFLCVLLFLCFFFLLFVSSCFPSLYVYVLSFSSSLGRLWPFPYVPVPLSVDRFCRSLSAMTVERSLLDGRRRLYGRLCRPLAQSPLFAGCSNSRLSIRSCLSRRLSNFGHLLAASGLSFWLYNPWSSLVLSVTRLTSAISR